MTDYGGVFGAMLFGVASRDLLLVVQGITAEQWERPATAEWTVRELAAHASRALTTAEAKLAPGDLPHQGDRPTLGSAAEYYLHVLVDPDLDTGVATRGRDEAARIGDEIVAYIAGLIERVVPLVDATPPDTLVDVFGETMRFGDYLHTRLVELVVHTDDLCRAVDRPSVADGELVRATAAALVGMLGADDVVALRALLGRGPLAGYNLFRPR